MNISSLLLSSIFYIHLIFYFVLQKNSNKYGGLLNKTTKKGVTQNRDFLEIDFVVTLSKFISCLISFLKANLDINKLLYVYEFSYKLF